MAERPRFFRPGMWKGVEAISKGWDTCARVNPRARKVLGMLKPLPVAQGHWEHVGVDSITDVPTSFRGNDCIVTFVDHDSKQAHWMPYTKTIDAAYFAQLFFEAITPLHGGPREIVSDGDTCFTSDSGQKWGRDYSLSCSCQRRFTHKQMGCQWTRISTARGIYTLSPLIIDTSGTPCFNLGNMHTTRLRTHRPIEARADWIKDTHSLINWTSWRANGSMTKCGALTVQCLLHDCNPQCWTPQTASVRHRTARWRKHTAAEGHVLLKWETSWRWGLKTCQKLTQTRTFLGGSCNTCGPDPTRSSGSMGQMKSNLNYRQIWRSMIK